MKSTVFLPTPSRFDVLDQPRQRLASAEGKAFALLNNGWACMDELTEFLDAQLREAGATAVYHYRTPHAMPSPEEFLDEIAAKVAGAITGLGN